MTYAAVAIGGGMIVGGMGAQAYFGNKAASSAKKAAAAAAAEAARARAAALGYQKPYYQSGTAGLNNLTGLLTGSQYDAQGNKTNLSEQDRSNLFQKSPGYQFRLEQGQKALEATQAARGGLLSGGAMKEMNKYSQGIASDEYGNYINQLAGLAGIGQNAANAMGNIEIGQGNVIAGYNMASGMAGANKYQNLGNSIGGGMQSIGGTLLGSGLSGMGGQSAGTSGSSWNTQSNSPNFNTQLGGAY
jgi:hypothetical protein